MAESFAKKEKEKKKARKKLEKEEKSAERKANNDKGKSLEEMIAYLDEDGNLTDIPPDKQVKRKFNSADLKQGSNVDTEKSEYTGILSMFFTDKAYGFITEETTRASVFVHQNNMEGAIQQNDSVTFKKEKTLKGFQAVQVRKR
jgi:CspA family cold shock protein